MVGAYLVHSEIIKGEDKKKKLGKTAGQLLEREMELAGGVGGDGGGGGLITVHAEPVHFCRLCFEERRCCL